MKLTPDALNAVLSAIKAQEAASVAAIRAERARDQAPAPKQPA